MRPVRHLSPFLITLVATIGCTERASRIAAPTSPTAIVNGDPTGNTYSNVGALLWDWWPPLGVLDGNDQWCTGSLISPTVFLTAAHCIAGLEDKQFYVSFAPDLLAKSVRFIKAKYVVRDPLYGHDVANLHDLAVVILPAAATTGIKPLQLPSAGELDILAARGALTNQLFVNVGYGTSATRTGPPAFPWDGLRKSSKSEFMALQPTWLGLLMNSNATDEGGDCYGDSGGPKFIDGNPNKIYATVTTGDYPCRATTWDWRLDTPEARGFLGRFVALP
jgi:hypothetical protein